MRAFLILALITLVSSISIGCGGSSSPATPTPEPCRADFIAEPVTHNCQVQGEKISCTGTTTIQFRDKSSGNITSWAWDFNGDEVIDSYEQNPTYTYRTNGNYTINLYITTSNCNDKATKSNYINITGCKT